MKKFLLSVFTLAVIALAGLYAVYTYAQKLGRTPIIPSIDRKFLINKGDTLENVIEKLIGNHNDKQVKLFIYLNPEYAKLRAGTFDLSNDHNLEEALKTLVTAKGMISQVRLIPGRTFKQWKENLSSESDLNNTLAGKTDVEVAKMLKLSPIEGDTNEFSNLEGYFLPETYHINYRAPLTQVFRVANRDLVKILTLAWENRSDKSTLKSPYELLILASIIEKEKGNNAEAPIISSVFYNRIKKGMMLQTDPTVIYGMGDGYNGNITRKDLQTPTPYNTYTIKGLPPTPICMVTENSIIAAAKPANTNYLYFVAVYGENKHDFSSTYREHAVKVQKYVRDYRNNN